MSGNSFALFSPPHIVAIAITFIAPFALAAAARTSPRIDKITRAMIAIVLALNAFFIWRKAQRDSRPFVSPSMKLAVRSTPPCLIFSAATTIWFFYDGYTANNELLLVRIWIGFYGLALIATQHFAPRSLVLLGWAFLITAAGMMVASRQLEYYSTPHVPNLAMGFTFGLYHLIYAACVWKSPMRAGNE